jgi:DNA replication initiation complex subunit (GINS family)
MQTLEQGVYQHLAKSIQQLEKQYDNSKNKQELDRQLENLYNKHSKGQENKLENFKDTKTQIVLSETFV